LEPVNIKTINNKNKIPKIVWLFWDSGFQNAPELVQHCLKSWQNKNPGWNIMT